MSAWDELRVPTVGAAGPGNPGQGQNVGPEHPAGGPDGSRRVDGAEQGRDVVVRTSGLSHRYGSAWALHDVDLEIERGSMYALLGPNGAGKSTLLRALMGLLRPSRGSVAVGGVPVGRLGAAERGRITYVAEGLELPGWMTLPALEAYLAPLYPHWDYALADHLRARFRIPGDRKLRTLSRGERMKAALLVALAPRPEILVADEPFTGMDALVRDELVYGLLEVAQNERWTVLLCSHDVGELEALADWVGFLDRGRLILSEPMEVLKDRFRKVEVRLEPGRVIELGSLPPTWLSPRRSGDRVRFVTCDHGVEGWEAEVRTSLPGTRRVAVQDASLREIFVALAAEGLGGRDWEREGGLT